MAGIFDIELHDGDNVKEDGPELVDAGEVQKKTLNQIN